ncbi:MAG: uracil-DNA glycosylase [Candidatus Gastranaerophilales bacterium]
MKKTSMMEIVKTKCTKWAGGELGKTAKNIVFGDGNVETAKIVLIGEAPGEMEDETGIPFVGRAGQLLNEFLIEAGISRECDLYIVNTVKCRPPENRVPTEAEIAENRLYLNAQIDIINPRAIVLCGATALKSFVELDKKQTISKVRGQWININVDGKDYNSMTIFHPSYLLRNHSMEDGSPRRLMQQDLAEIKNAYLSDVNHDFSNSEQSENIFANA